MAENLNPNELKKAREVYETLCGALDARGWTYQKHDDDLYIEVRVSGEDIPMNFRIIVDGSRQLVRVVSWLPFDIVPEHRVEVAIATSQINYGLANGCFRFDLETGEVRFTLASSYRDSIISMNLLQYMISVSCNTVDDYNDKLMMINKGYLSLADFMKNL